MQRNRAYAADTKQGEEERGTVIIDLNPWDPRSVARWAATKVWEEAESRLLWLRINLSGPGYMLTTPEAAPRGGMWTRVALIDVEDAMRIAQRGPRGWPALCRLAEKIEEALPPAA